MTTVPEPTPAGRWTKSPNSLGPRLRKAVASLATALLLLASMGAAGQDAEPPPAPAVVEPHAPEPETPATPKTPAPSVPAGLPVAEGDRLIFVRDGDLWTTEPSGAGARPLTSTPEREVRPVPSPDGAVVAYELYDTDKQDYDLWVQPLEGGGPRRLMERARNPAWSPDGGRLLFAMRRRSSLDLWLINRDGSGLMRLLDTPDNEYLPVWGPTAAKMAFVREIREANLTRYELVVRAADETEQVVLSRLGQGITSLCWAPSNDLLFTSRNEDDPLDRLYRVAPDGGDAEEVTSGFDGGASGVWTGIGDGILYLERRNEQSRIAFLLDGRSLPVANLRDGDAEPALLPGGGRRAPQIHVLGRPSYYLPSPRVLDDDILVPLPDLAAQLSLIVTGEGSTVTVASPNMVITLDPATGRASVATRTGPDERAILPSPVVVAGVLLVPIKTLSEWFGLRAEWRPAERVMRISRPTEPTPPPATGEPTSAGPQPEPAPDTAAPPTAGPAPGGETPPQ